MINLVNLPSKDPAEVIGVTFDFGPEIDNTEAIVGTPAVAVSLVTGIDPAPNDVLSGGAVVFDTQVLQKVRGGLDGVAYKLVCTINLDSGRVLMLGAVLPVVTL